MNDEVEMKDRTSQDFSTIEMNSLSCEFVPAIDAAPDAPKDPLKAAYEP